MLVDENQRMAEEKRRAKLAERMRDRSAIVLNDNELQTHGTATHMH